MARSNTMMTPKHSGEVWEELAPEHVVQLWKSADIGIEDAADLAGLYTSGDQVCVDLQARGVSETDAVQAVSAWQQARLAAGFIDRMRAGTVRTLLQDARPSRTVSLPQRGYESKKRKYAKLMLQDQVNHPSQFVDGSQRCKRSKVKATEASLDELYQVYLALGPVGAKWTACEPGEEAVRKRLMLRPFLKMDEQRLRALLAALRRWERWNAGENTKTGNC